jgi:hypothetical protein
MEHLAYQQDAYHMVDDFLKIRQGQNDIEVLTKWRGFDIDGASWEPAQTLAADVPELFARCLHTLRTEEPRAEKAIAAQAV